MLEIDLSLLNKVEQFVTDQLKSKLPEGILYHSADHARKVVNAIDEIGKKEGLGEEEMILSKIAGWFHDIGFTESHEDHEIKSAEIANRFLKDAGLDEKHLIDVEKAIMATIIPQNPKNKIGAVLCDADMYHVTTNEYFEQANLMREEFKLVKNMETSKGEFEKLSFIFFSQHHFHTEYGKTVLQEKKDATMKLLQEKIEKTGAKREKEVKKLNKEIEKLQGKLEQKKGYSRGVESMFRLTARNQINLSAIADNKSNILITVNTLILTIALTVLVARFEEYPNIILPSLIFVGTSLITIILAILSTRPQISSGKFTEHDIKQKSVNLLFFGNFYNMDLDEYDWALREMMKEDDYLYSTMIKDQYALGKVLAKKYKLIRLSFNVFMFGLIVTVIAFVLSFVSF